MDQLSVKKTWPPIIRMEKTFRNKKIEFIFQKYKPKEKRAVYVRAVYYIIL